MNKVWAAPREPFDFYESPWWKDANDQLCRGGWPTYVVAVNCMVRDAKSAYDQLQERVKKLEAALESHWCERSEICPYCKALEKL